MAELSVPKIDFSPLGDLPNIYREGVKRRTLAEIGSGLADGSLDYNAAGAKLAGLGDLNSGLSLIKLGQEQKASQDFMRSIPALYGGGQSASSGQPVSNPMGNAANAIASIESGGRYDAQGPVTRTGDRAFGKYQVMGKNIGPWTQEVLGRAMTPQEFLSSPEAQDKVFQAKFGQYSQKYGPNGAARAWFAGEGGMNDPNRRDINGTSVADYGNRFDRAMGFAPTQVASNDPSAGVSQPQAQPQTQPQLQQAQQLQSAPQGDGFSISPRIQGLLQAVASPRLPAAQKDVAKILLQRELDNSKLPEPVKQYMFARSQGYQGSFMEYQTELKKAGATNVTVDQKGETKFEEEFGKKQADRWNGYLTNADAARKKLVDIDTMREISGRLGSQGAAAGIKESIGPYAEALGINVDGLSDIQAYTQIIQRLAPQQRAVGSGSTSDIEFKGFLKSLPGLSQNPAAREAGLNTMEALARDDLARGEIASKLATGEIKRAEAERQLRALPDPMKGFVEWRKANPELYKQALRSKPEQSSSQPARSGSPPMQGARQAPDGQWYIQQNGKWFRVDQ